MSQQQRTAGASFETITIGDIEYELSQLRFGHYAEMEAYVSSLKEDPIDIAAAKSKKLPASQQQELWDAAVRVAQFQKTIPASVMADFEQSVRGLAWKFWKCLAPNHPEINTVESALGLLIEAGGERLSEIKSKVTLASGEADLKK